MPQITVERTFKLDDLELVTREDMQDVGLLAKELIFRRTIAGIDVDGVPFASYSPGYAATKMRELGTATVNLQVSGNMLNHLQIINVDENSVELGWLQ